MGLLGYAHGEYHALGEKIGLFRLLGAEKAAPEGRETRPAEAPRPQTGRQNRPQTPP